MVTSPPSEDPRHHLQRQRGAAAGPGELRGVSILGDAGSGEDDLSVRCDLRGGGALDGKPIYRWPKVPEESACLEVTGLHAMLMFCNPLSFVGKMPTRFSHAQPLSCKVGFVYLLAFFLAVAVCMTVRTVHFERFWVFGFLL